MKSLPHLRDTETCVSPWPTLANLFACLLLFVMSTVTNNLQAQTYTDRMTSTVRLTAAVPLMQG